MVRASGPFCYFCELIVDHLATNPLPLSIQLNSVTATVGIDGTDYADFSVTFPKNKFVIPPGKTVNSGIIPNVLLTQGAEASLGM